MHVAVVVVAMVVVTVHVVGAAVVVVVEVMHDVVAAVVLEVQVVAVVLRLGRLCELEPVLCLARECLRRRGPVSQRRRWLPQATSFGWLASVHVILEDY